MRLLIFISTILKWTTILYSQDHNWTTADYNRPQRYFQPTIERHKTSNWVNRFSFFASKIISSERTRKPRNVNLPKTQKFLKIQNTKFTLLILKIHLFYSKSNLCSEFWFRSHFFTFSFENSPFYCKINFEWVIFKRFHVENGCFHVFGWTVQDLCSYLTFFETGS